MSLLCGHFICSHPLTWHLGAGETEKIRSPSGHLWPIEAMAIGKLVDLPIFKLYRWWRPIRKACFTLDSGRLVITIGNPPGWHHGNRRVYWVSMVSGGFEVSFGTMMDASMDMVMDSTFEWSFPCFFPKSGWPITSPVHWCLKCREVSCMSGPVRCFT